MHHGALDHLLEFQRVENSRSVEGEQVPPRFGRKAPAFVRAEIKKWDEVGKAVNIQPTE